MNLMIIISNVPYQDYDQKPGKIKPTSTGSKNSNSNSHKGHNSNRNKAYNSNKKTIRGVLSQAIQRIPKQEITRRTRTVMAKKSTNRIPPIRKKDRKIMFEKILCANTQSKSRKEKLRLEKNHNNGFVLLHYLGRQVFSPLQTLLPLFSFKIFFCALSKPQKQRKSRIMKPP